MNQTGLIGRITRDVEITYSQSGTAIFKNSIAVNRKFKREETDFINILAFGKTAELIGNHVNKGDQLGIEGHIQTGSYEKEGKKVYTFEVVVDSITFISSGNKSNNTSSANNSNRQPSNAPQNAGVGSDPFAGNGQIDISDDMLPF